MYWPILSLLECHKTGPTVKQYLVRIALSYCPLTVSTTILFCDAFGLSDKYTAGALLIFQKAFILIYQVCGNSATYDPLQLLRRNILVVSNAINTATHTQLSTTVACNIGSIRVSCT